MSKKSQYTREPTRAEEAFTAAPVVSTLDGQVATLTLCKHVPLRNDRNLEELTDRFRLLMPAGSHGEVVTSIEVNETLFIVTIGAEQRIYIPAANVTSYTLYRAPR
jgi:hypothetical protein